MMFEREDIYFDSCGAGRIHAAVWFGDEKPKAVVQIVHGIAEHVLRYEEYAEYLVEHGFAVVAEDHMGHGMSVSEKTPLGYFEGGWFAAVDDAMKLMQLARQRFGDVPYFLFGHSMGSFMARTILAKYPDSGISGCVICGTGWQSEALLAVSIPAAKLICKRDGEKNPSALLKSLAFGSYNKRVEHLRTENDWLTRDDRTVDAYNADPLCGFTASAGLMRDMLSGISYIQTKDALAGMNKQTPCFFIAGGDDPVGEYGKGVRKAVDAFKKAGMESVSVRIYPLCRHEILNEINREEVYEDVLEWMEKLI